MRITGSSRIYGIFGDPIQHTFSPSMHNLAFETIGLNAVYLPFHVLPANLKEAVEGLRSLQIQGINVTVPHKTAIIPYLDEITLSAKRIGAVNTIRNDEGKLIGTNTDGEGFLNSLEEISFSPTQKTILLLGAGGSSRAILVALAQANVAEIFIWNRSAHKAQHLAQEFQTEFPQLKINAVQKIEELQPYPIDLLVNTTSVGMNGVDSVLNLEQWSGIQHVVDIIYHPRKTPLLLQASEKKIASMNGLGMLLYQGVLAFEFWTQQKAPIQQMKTQLLSLVS